MHFLYNVYFIVAANKPPLSSFARSRYCKLMPRHPSDNCEKKKKRKKKNIYFQFDVSSTNTAGWIESTLSALSGHFASAERYLILSQLEEDTNKPLTLSENSCENSVNLENKSSYFSYVRMVSSN
ncbi:hypothetical protein PUN28_009984 [Cardiocondyla obscurior]|uniref:Uncharacterized protein n=1 Tax=Cardiocondyla obscurior TaxID=286306 RepID=A0AAW2FNP3_9HYME